MDDATIKAFGHIVRRLFGRIQRQSLATLSRRQLYGHLSYNGVGAGDVMQRPPLRMAFTDGRLHLWRPPTAELYDHAYS